MIPHIKKGRREERKKGMKKRMKGKNTKSVQKRVFLSVYSRSLIKAGDKAVRIVSS